MGERVTQPVCRSRRRQALSGLCTKGSPELAIAKRPRLFSAEHMGNADTCRTPYFRPSSSPSPKALILPGSSKAPQMLEILYSGEVPSSYVLLKSHYPCLRILILSFFFHLIYHSLYTKFYGRREVRMSSSHISLPY